MSTIASPRPSLSQPHSRCTSASTISTLANSDTAGVDRGTLRRNKASALRDYYGLNASATPPRESLEEVAELDQPNFQPDNYVSSLLRTENMPTLFRAEVALVQEVRSLEGEKKALVYDNYSKLIAATETISRMRNGMDPMTPTTRSLGPAIAHIAETASSLSEERKKVQGDGSSSAHDLAETAKEQKDARDTVRWTLSAPDRLREFIVQGKRQEAEKEAQDVLAVLDKWRDTKGVAQLREAIIDTMKGANQDG